MRRTTMALIATAGMWAWAASGAAAESRVEDAFQPEHILSLADQVYTHTLDNPYTATDRNWIRATFYSGVMELYRATGNEKYREQATRWAEKHGWQVGTEGSGFNKLFCAMTWAELHLLDPDPKKLAPTLEWLATDEPNSPGGARVWYGHAGPPYDRPLYSDALYGAPVFAMLSTATGDRKYLDIMHHAFWHVTETVLDKEDGLYYRDPSYIGTRSPNGEKVLWSRGNGWVFAAFPRILKYLPEDDPQRERYVDLFRRMAASLAVRQQPDGFWHSNLADPWHYRMPESSGTAFFVAGYAWGVRNGILDRPTYLPVVIRGWKALVGAVHPSGKLGWVQPVDAQPRPSQPETSHEYADGLFLFAAAETALLAREGAFTTASLQAATPAETDLLPPAALRATVPGEQDHPLHAQIRAFLKTQEGRSVEPTGLTRQDYLEAIAGQLRAVRGYQDAEGRIIDPVEQQEKHFATPCYAHCVAALASAGHPGGEELMESGMKALDAALEALATARPADRHGDFYTWPAVGAYELFLPLASEERIAQWKNRLATMDPSKTYGAFRPPIYDHRPFYDEYHNQALRDDGRYTNWTMVNVAGEFSRALHGFTDLAYVDYNLTMQLPRFTPHGMYSERGNPLAYDLFARHYATAMLQRGYRSFHHATYRDLLWRGAWTSLLMQSPFGELPTGHRSSHHIWNEAEQAVVFEIYASAYAEAGRMAEAGAFKRAARLALASVTNWIRPDGSGYVIKNRYPIEAQHGYESYSTHTAYNLLAAAMLAQAWQYADDEIEEQVCPAEVGGFAFATPRFRKVFVNAGGTFIQYDTSGDLEYNPTGLIRIHLRDGHPQLGPSDGCAAKYSGEGNHFAVGPTWQDDQGDWHRLAGLTGLNPVVEVLEASPERVRLRVAHSVPQGRARVQLIETITVTPDDVLVENEVQGQGISRIRVDYPMLVFDGAEETAVQLAEKSVQLTLQGRSVRFEALDEDAKLIRSGQRLNHRNGVVEPVYYEIDGTSARYRISSGAPETN